MFTSLKALKWSYGLGIKQERQRIASYLQLEAQQARLYNDVAHDTPLSKQRRQKLESQMAINSRVQEIINGMFESHTGEWLDGPSFMFPDKEEK